MPGAEATMDEFKKGTLHSGSKTGPKVTSRDQAIAIAMSEEDKAKAAKKKHFAQHMKKAHKAWAESDENPHNKTRM